MNKNIVFSIIIPVYNMELFLNRCLESVVNQTYKHLEIIIVNDGSKDKSFEIIKYYSDTDNRIIVINKENEGIGGAYMDALKIVSGDYISFIDGDDYVELNMYEILYKHITDKNPDILQFGYTKFNEHNTVLAKVNFGLNYIVGNINIENYRFKKIKHPSIGLKVVKKNILENVRILKQNIGIDVIITVQVYLLANTFLSITNELYHVYQRENSVGRSHYNDNTIKQLMNYRNLLFKIVMSVKDQEIISHYLPTLVNESIVIGNYYYKRNEKEILNHIVKEYKEYYELHKNILKKCNIMIRIKTSLFRYFPILYFNILSSRIKQ